MSLDEQDVGESKSLDKGAGSVTDDSEKSLSQSLWDELGDTFSQGASQAERTDTGGLSADGMLDLGDDNLYASPLDADLGGLNLDGRASSLRAGAGPDARLEAGSFLEGVNKAVEVVEEIVMTPVRIVEAVVKSLIPGKAPEGEPGQAPAPEQRPGAQQPAAGEQPGEQRPEGKGGQEPRSEQRPEGERPAEQRPEQPSEPAEKKTDAEEEKEKDEEEEEPEEPDEEEPEEEKKEKEEREPRQPREYVPDKTGIEYIPRRGRQVSSDDV